MTNDSTAQVTTDLLRLWPKIRVKDYQGNGTIGQDEVVEATIRYALAGGEIGIVKNDDGVEVALDNKTMDKIFEEVVRKKERPGILGPLSEKQRRAFDVLIGYMKAEGIKRELHEKGIAPAKYDRMGDTISMYPRAYFASDDSYLSSLAHECIHSAGHPRRVGRESMRLTKRLRDIVKKDYESDFKKLRALEEMTAEIGSAIFMVEFDLDAQIRDMTAYVKGFHKDLGLAIEEDQTCIFQAAMEAKRSIDFIIKKGKGK